MEGDICPKCGKGEEVEKLSKCYKAGDTKVSSKI